MEHLTLFGILAFITCNLNPLRIVMYLFLNPVTIFYFLFLYRIFPNGMINVVLAYVICMPIIGIIFGCWFIGSSLTAVAQDKIKYNDEAICETAEAWHLNDAKPLTTCISACMNGANAPRICKNLYDAGMFSDGKPGNKDVWRPGMQLAHIRTEKENDQINRHRYED